MNLFDDEHPELENMTFKMIDRGEVKFYKVKITKFLNNMQTLKVL